MCQESHDAGFNSSMNSKDKKRQVQPSESYLAVDEHDLDRLTVEYLKIGCHDGFDRQAGTCYSTKRCLRLTTPGIHGHKISLDT